VRIFTLLDEPILDAICENLRQKLYIRGSNLLYQGGTVEKMVFIVRGKLESIGADGHVALLQDGDVCGEELITWYLEQHSSGLYKGYYLLNFYSLYHRSIILLSE
jgi:cyclic nucleotide gated channel, plant